MQLAQLDDKTLIKVLSGLLTTKQISCSLEYRDVKSFDPRCHTGYKINNRQVRVLEPVTLIEELSELLRVYQPSKLGGAKLNIKLLQEFLEALEDGQYDDID